MVVLGIETSCDETSAALVADGRSALVDIVASQADLHARWGGVVPEVASRMHVERVLPVVQEAMEKAKITSAEIDGIAVTNRPGLIGALVVGVAAAKALALAWNRPLVGVHHLIGHIYACYLAEPRLVPPFVCLIVSGGHTELIYVDRTGECTVLGRTRDDAAGECLDKCARMLDLPYPGGAHLERLAEQGDPQRVPLPRAWLEGSADFSFSGLKTAVARYLKQNAHEFRREDVAAALQGAVVDVLVEKTVAAARSVGVEAIGIGGGVAANRTLSRAMADAARTAGIRCITPLPPLCTDNASMIAAAGYDRLIRGEDDGLGLDAAASAPLPRASSVEGT